MKKLIILFMSAIMIFVFAGCNKQNSKTTTNTPLRQTPSISPTKTTKIAETTEVTATPTVTPTVTPTATPTVIPTATPLKTPSNTFDITNWKPTKDNFPKLDGSTANIPMANLIIKKLLKMSDTQITQSKMTEFATTPYAYDNLIKGETDLLLVYEADKDTKNRIKKSGVELEYYPIGKDALVFITNEINKIQSLTEGQIQDIYQGKITNWNQVSGDDVKIEAFQRPTLSGSQALMVKLVMREKQLTNPPSEYYPEGMAGLIEVLADYNNSGGAIGYSVYYYAKNMYAKDGLKFIAVNGVMPNNQTIASGEYPYVNEFYAVIRADEPKDSNTRKLLYWLFTEDGRKIVEEAGYVGLKQ